MVELRTINKDNLEEVLHLSVSENQKTLWKFLIDKDYQRKGYGKDALKQGINYLIKNFDVKEVYTGVTLGNEIAKHLYSSIGFEATGAIEDNMEEMKYIIC